MILARDSEVLRQRLSGNACMLIVKRDHPTKIQKLGLGTVVKT